MPDPPPTEDVPDDPLPDLEDSSAAPEEPPASLDVPLQEQEQEPAADAADAEAGQAEDEPSTTEEVSLPQPASEPEHTENNAPDEVSGQPELLGPEMDTGDEAGLRIPPPAPEPPVELDLDIPPPPPGSFDDMMAALDAAPTEMVDVLEIPPPPAPEPPPTMEAEVPADALQDEPPAGPLDGQIENADKKVSFAPGTPEPKPTHRKKKNATGSKKKKKKSAPAESEEHPDDIVAIIEGDSIALPEPPPLIDSAEGTEAIDETVAMQAAPGDLPHAVTEVDEVNDVETNHDDEPATHDETTDNPLDATVVVVPIEKAAPTSKLSSKKSAKSSSKEKTKKKAGKSKAKKSVSEPPPAGLGIETNPSGVAETQCAPSVETAEAVAEDGVAVSVPETEVIPIRPAEDSAALHDDATDRPDNANQTAPEANTTEADVAEGSSERQDLECATEQLAQSNEKVEVDGDAAGSTQDASAGINDGTGPIQEVPAEEVSQHTPEVSNGDDDADSASSGDLDHEGVGDAEGSAGQAGDQSSPADSTEAPSIDSNKDGDEKEPATVEDESAQDPSHAEQIGTDDQSSPADSARSPSVGPTKDSHERELAAVGDESAQDPDHAEQIGTEEPEPAASETCDESAQATTPDQPPLDEGPKVPEYSATDEDVPVEEVAKETEAGVDQPPPPASDDHQAIDRDGAADVPGPDGAQEDVAEGMLEEAEAADADAEEVVEVTIAQEVTDTCADQDAPEVLEEADQPAVGDGTPAVEPPATVEEDLAPIEEEEEGNEEPAAGKELDTSSTNGSDQPDALSESATPENILQDEQLGVVGAVNSEAATTMDISEAPGEPDAMTAENASADNMATGGDRTQAAEPVDSAVEPQGVMQQSDIKDASPDISTPTAEDNLSPVLELKEPQEKGTANEEQDKIDIATEDSAPVGDAAGVEVVQESSTLPEEDAAAKEPVLASDTTESAAADEDQEAPAVVVDNPDIVETEQSPDDSAAAEVAEKTTAEPADGDAAPKEEPPIVSLPEPNVAAEALAEASSDPAPDEATPMDGHDVVDVPEQDAQSAAEEATKAGDTVASDADKQVNKTLETSEALPEAPPSPAVSKGSTKDRRDERVQSSKKSSSEARSSDKRSRRASTSEPKSRSDRHRSRRLSMTAEEEAERKKRREARAVLKAEEAARVAAQAKRKADEEAERQLRHEARRAAKRAAVKEAEEVARRIAREEAEAEAKMAAEARRRRRERRDSAIERERPRERERDRDRDRNRDKDRQRRSERARYVDRGYDDSKPVRPPLLKALTIGTGESSTKAGLLIRTGSDGRAPRDGGRRSSFRENKSRDSPLPLNKAPRGERENGSDRGSHHSRRSGDAKVSDEPRGPGNELLRTLSNDPPPVLERSSTDRPHRRRRESTITDERDREGSHRSRRESERRERRPTLDDKGKKKKSSFMGSLLKAFR